MVGHQQGAVRGRFIQQPSPRLDDQHRIVVILGHPIPSGEVFGLIEEIGNEKQNVTLAWIRTTEFPGVCPGAAIMVTPPTISEN